MSENSKNFPNSDSFNEALKSMLDYQKRHNMIRLDYELLLEITELHKKDQDKFNTLFRASLKGFFSLIESDIYGLNKLDAYEGYDDHIGSFEFKFKKTFKQVCKTWNKKEIIQLYLDSKYGKLKSLKQKRNNLVHPKEVPDILIASEEGLNDIKECFNDYTKMLHSIMNNFFISIEIKDSEDLNELFK